MLSDFITELKQSKYYQNIIDNHKVIMMYVSGSRIIDVTDERSDYDIVAVVDDSDVNDAEEFLTYDGVKAHWYYIPLSEFIAGNGKNALRSYGAVLFANIREEVVICVNPEYEAVYKLLTLNKNYIAANGFKNMCRRYGRLIDSVAETGEILPQHYTKILSHLCVASLAITGERLSDETRNLLRQLKRIRWQPVSDEAKEWCVERVKLIKRITDFGNLCSAYSVL